MIIVNPPVEGLLIHSFAACETLAAISVNEASERSAGNISDCTVSWFHGVDRSPRRPEGMLRNSFALAFLSIPLFAQSQVET